MIYFVGIIFTFTSGCTMYRYPVYRYINPTYCIHKLTPVMLTGNSLIFFSWLKNSKYISAEEKASNKSTCSNLGIGIDDRGQYPICPKPEIVDIQNRVSLLSFIHRIVSNLKPFIF